VTITNRERWLARELVRNSYELNESEIDEIIVGTLRGVDVDAKHQERCAEDDRREREGWTHDG
jgi:hypothetical protein